jgi:hypothetical protein
MSASGWAFGVVSAADAGGKYGSFNALSGIHDRCHVAVED